VEDVGEGRAREERGRAIGEEGRGGEVVGREEAGEEK